MQQEEKLKCVCEIIRDKCSQGRHGFERIPYLAMSKVCLPFLALTIFLFLS
jgi:hypothetical protein